MSVSIATLDELQQHLARAIGHAGDRARKLGPAALTLAGAILWLKDPGPIEVRGGNIAWVAIGGAKYLLRYDPHARRLEMRSGRWRQSTVNLLSEDREGWGAAGPTRQLRHR